MPRSEFSDKTRRIVHQRAGSCCERCGRSIVNIPAEMDHRRAKGMGGSLRKSTHSPANASLLCADCHRWKHANPNKAADSGWHVRQWESPETVPLIDAFGNRFLFEMDGSRVDL